MQLDFITYHKILRVPRNLSLMSADLPCFRYKIEKENLNDHAYNFDY